MSSDGTDPSNDRRRDEERNPFVAFKRHVDQRFAALLGLQQHQQHQHQQHQHQQHQHQQHQHQQQEQHQYTRSQRRWNHHTKDDDAARPHDDGNEGASWERAMKDFEESEKEAKEWYDTVLRQITSRRDEHLESGLGFDGQRMASSARDEVEVTQCPYLPAKEDRVELLPKREEGQGRCTRQQQQQPHSRFLDWVWTGWGGPSTTPEMLWYSESGAAQGTGKSRGKGCMWSEAVPTAVYSAQSAVAVDEEEPLVCPALSGRPPRSALADEERSLMCPALSDRPSQAMAVVTRDEERQEMAPDSGSGDMLALINGLKQDLKQVFEASLNGDVNSEEYRQRIASFNEMVERGEEVARRTAQQIMDSESVMQFLGPMMFGSGLWRPVNRTEENAEEQTELGAYEHVLKGQPADTQSGVLALVREVQKAAMPVQESVRSAKVLSQSSETRTDELGNTYSTWERVETVPDGRVKTETYMSYTDPQGNLLGEQSSESYSSDSEPVRTPASQTSPSRTAFSQRPPQVAEGQSGTYQEAMKLLEKQKKEQKQKGGWFWTS